jgi:hypothetical protein
MRRIGAEVQMALMGWFLLEGIWDMWERFCVMRWSRMEALMKNGGSLGAVLHGKMFKALYAVLCNIRIKILE